MLLCVNELILFRMLFMKVCLLFAVLRLSHSAPTAQFGLGGFGGSIAFSSASAGAGGGFGLPGFGGSIAFSSASAGAGGRFGGGFSGAQSQAQAGSLGGFGGSFSQSQAQAQSFSGGFGK